MTQTEPLTKLNGDPLRSQRPIDYAVNQEHKAAYEKWAETITDNYPEQEIENWLWETIAQLTTTVKLQQQLLDKVLKS